MELYPRNQDSAGQLRPTSKAIMSIIGINAINAYIYFLSSKIVLLFIFYTSYKERGVFASPLKLLNIKLDSIMSE
jgi:hypothetical protein